MTVTDLSNKINPGRGFSFKILDDIRTVEFGDTYWHLVTMQLRDGTKTIASITDHDLFDLTTRDGWIKARPPVFVFSAQNTSFGLVDDGKTYNLPHINPHDYFLLSKGGLAPRPLWRRALKAVFGNRCSKKIASRPIFFSKNWHRTREYEFLD